MRLTLCACLLFFSTNVFSFEKYHSIIYLISGGPIDAWNPERVHKAWESLKESILASHAGLNLYVEKIHQSQKDSICENIISLKAGSPSASIILMGHSYGGHSGVQISRCLEEKGIQVDLLVTSDTVTKHLVEFDTAHDIPANVKNNFHYYEDGDPFLSGTSYNYQSKPGAKIRNFLQTLGYVPVKAHMDAISNLIDYKILYTLAAGVLKGMSSEELDASVKPVNAVYFEKYPVHEPWEN